MFIYVVNLLTAETKKVRKRFLRAAGCVSRFTAPPVTTICGTALLAAPRGQAPVPRPAPLLIIMESAPPPESTEYERMESALESPQIGRRVMRPAAAMLLVGLVVGVVVSPSAMADHALVVMQLKSAPVAHTGEWCKGSGAKTYTKTTLKTIADRPIAGLLTYEAGSTESKFEASDVIRVGEDFLAICDSSWSILRVSDSLPVLSHANRLIGHDDAFVPPEVS